MTCAAQKLKCQFDISRLDPGGLTIRNMTITGANPAQPPLKAGKIAVDLAWSAPWSVRAKAVASEGVALRLDLREGRPLLGELQGLLDPYLKPSGKPSPPLPRLDLKTIAVIIETAAGPVEADGQMLATSASDFTLDITAKPARIGYQGAELDLKTATLNASGSGQTLKGVIKLDLAMFKSATASVEAMKIDGDFSQTATGMKGRATASASRLAMTEGGIEQGDVKVDLESDPLDPNNLTMEHVLTRIRSLRLDGKAEQGVFADAHWKSGVVSAAIDPTNANNADGKLQLTVSDISHVLGKADRLDITGDLHVARGTMDGKGRSLLAAGTAKISGASIADGPSRLVSGMIIGMLKSSLPDFADAADKASKSAGSKFDFSAPWTFKVDDGGVDAAALSGMKLQAKSGLTGTFEHAGAKEVFIFSQRGGAAKWAAGGSLRASGGGFPQVVVDVTKASGEGAKFAAAGGAEVKPWKLKSNVLSLKASGLDFGMDGAAGHAAADVLVTYDGLVSGATVSGARAQGAMKASWTEKDFAAEAPRGLEVGWGAAKVSGMAIGAGALHYTPAGRLAEKRGSGLGGAGRIEAISLPITGDGFKAGGKLGPTAISWTAGEATAVSFDTSPSSFDLTPKDGGPVLVTLASVKGAAKLSAGWVLEGSFSGGSVKSDAALVNDLHGAFKLAGDAKGAGGDLTGLELRIVDPHAAAERAFEAVKATGAAKLAGSRIDFNGAFNLASTGASLGTVSGFHDLDKANGEARFARTTLTFAPGTFEPSQLSPLLRGPGNVAGKVTVQAGARWSEGKGPRAFADIELADLGFALAGAGVFEKVAGKVRIDDLIKMTSPPGQTITVGKITLGLPIEQGTIKFQLQGAKAIKLESASWPFVDGQIRIKPLVFSLEPNAANSITAQAVNWDMNKLVTLFDLKDLKLQGHIGGDFPVVFSTGSAKIVNAELNATDKGVVQYTGSTGDAAGTADPNAKMLFDALKDFNFEVMKVTIDGDIAGRITLGAHLRGRSPRQNNSFFEFNLSVDSDLMKLLNTPSQAAATIEDITRAAAGGRN